MLSRPTALADLSAHGVSVTRLVSALGPQAVSFEVVFHWRDLAVAASGDA